MRIMNRLVATEGRDKGGKLVLITSRLNAEGGGGGKGERKEGKRSALVISTRPLPVMTALFPFARSPRRLPSAVCLRRHHEEDVSISSSAILHEGERYSFGISLDDLQFPLENDGRVEEKKSK